MFIHFCCLCPLDLDNMLKFNVSKGAYSLHPRFKMKKMLYIYFQDFLEEHAPRILSIWTSVLFADIYTLTGRGRQSDRHYQLLHAALDSDASPCSQAAQSSLLFLQCQSEDAAYRPHAGRADTRKTGEQLSKRWMNFNAGQN